MFLGSALLLTAQLCWSWPDFIFSCKSAMAFSTKTNSPAEATGRQVIRFGRAGSVDGGGREGYVQLFNLERRRREGSEPLPMGAATVLVACLLASWGAAVAGGDRTGQFPGVRLETAADCPPPSPGVVWGWAEGWHFERYIERGGVRGRTRHGPVRHGTTTTYFTRDTVKTQFSYYFF